MAYTTPKTNWIAGDLLKYTDTNRIEGNTKQNHEDFYGAFTGAKPHGFEIFANTGNGIGAYNISVGAGRTVSSLNDGIIYNPSTFLKLLSADSWIASSGLATPCLTPGLTFYDNFWYYVFIIKNPTTGSIDVVVDSDILGSNYKASSVYTTYGFTLYRRVAALKTTTLIDTSGFVPTHGYNGRFYFGGGTAGEASLAGGRVAVQDFSSSVDSDPFPQYTVDAWDLEDSEGLNITPPGIKCNSTLSFEYDGTYTGTYYAYSESIGVGTESLFYAATEFELNYNILVNETGRIKGFLSGTALQTGQVATTKCTVRSYEDSFIN
jgi:hypothetical protein